MLAQLTAFDVLVLVLVLGSVAAICGWAGGAGARLSFSMRLRTVEGYLLQLINRSKGAAGQAKLQEQRQRETSVQGQAEQLAAKLRGVRLAPPVNWDSIPEDDPRALAELERRARASGLVGKKD